MKKQRKLRRDECFLGIHFDFHATEKDKDIGKNTTREMIQEIIDKTLVDYIQIDCKGHPGFASYGTKFSNKAPGLIRDALPLWRQVTEENNVALFMHYSGVSDWREVKVNPENARIDENGKEDNEKTSFFGSYAETVMIPQIIELCDDYKVDGVWVDGDCWAARADYSEKALEAFKKEYNITKIPLSKEDENFHLLLEFSRKKFMEYLKNYVDSVHRHNKDFQICSNWAFSSYMPEKVSVNVDFLSGDYNMKTALEFADFEARVLQNQEMPWDLMGWGFTGEMGKANFSTKTPIQIMQEASVVLAAGGGFQVYFIQNRDGTVKSYNLDVMAEVARFCRERQQFCHKAKPIKQIALLYSKTHLYRTNEMPFRGWSDHTTNCYGLLKCVIEGQNPIGIVSEHHNLEEYPVVILPEVRFLEENCIKRLLSYAQSGGNLIITGEAIELFKDELNIFFEKNPDCLHYLKNNNFNCVIEGGSFITKIEGANFGEIINKDDTNLKGTPAATVFEYGKGKIGIINFNLGYNYYSFRKSAVRNFLNDIINEMFKGKIVNIKGSRNIETALMKKDDKTYLHLINISGEHNSIKPVVFDEIPPTGKIDISLNLNEKVKKLTLLPGSTDILFEGDKKISFSIDNVEIMETVEISFLDKI